MREILLLGQQGQVAWELQVALATLGRVTVWGSQELDLADPDRIRDRLRALEPQIIVNAAAYTAVDKAEQEPALCQAINATAPGVIAELAREFGALLVHYSTEYVFDGTKTSPYLETDTPNPLGVYGASKLAGEQAIIQAGCAHLILRTTWVYGNRGKNFLLTILRLAAERPELKIVADQVGAPTWSKSIAMATSQILARCGDRDPATISGIYNLSAAGKTSWHGFASEIVDRYRTQFPDRALQVTDIVPIPASDYPTPAQRPAYSVLDNSKVLTTFGVQIPAWDLSLGQLFARW
ncbi:dTDP-4-dehydrorhamnose reductase [Chamaesiphon sp. OTE_8_metabat_110]|uniref:dTDP-4-dehydrorhamnose reductase n=1 Tax=Chamaesiphon sp. OTE_8_metabat_110 TaxID=2964696 RepID=UPI00286ACD28|nr:dTDP-4-dehydrorhamnose reductase [Chamaesiphon sp. OTE_8_metabat_110]